MQKSANLLAYVLMKSLFIVALAGMPAYYTGTCMAYVYQNYYASSFYYV